MEKVTVKRQAHHRNGVGGAPFIVSLFEVAGENGTFVGISFQPNSGFESRAQARADFILHTAVLNVEETAKGNVAFAEGNSWRGSDRYGPALADAYAEQCNAPDPRYPSIGGWDPFEEMLSDEARDRLDAERAPKPSAPSDEEMQALDYLSGNPLFADLIDAAKARIANSQ